MLFKNQEKQENLLTIEEKKNQKVHAEKKCGNKKFITTEFYLLKVKFKNQDYFNEKDIWNPNLEHVKSQGK